MNKLTKLCPYCNNVIEFKFPCQLKYALRTDKTCSNVECRKRRKRENVSGEKNPMFGKFGALNPFYGKSHTKETKDKMSDYQKNNIHKHQTYEVRQKKSKASTGEKNPMFGKSIYSVWLKKYGKATADQKMIDYKKLQSKLNSGEHNNMFGKPSPIGSGNGISGWYNGHYFRSILELTYLVKVIDRFKLKWQTGESKKFRIPYIDDNINRNYYSDFIIENKYMIECKPVRLLRTPNNILKQQAAKEYCRIHSLIYKTFSTSFIGKVEFIQMVESGQILLTKKWKDKYYDGTLKFK